MRYKELHIKYFTTIYIFKLIRNSSSSSESSHNLKKNKVYFLQNSLNYAQNKKKIPTDFLSNIYSYSETV
jgi:hypothetical protein